MSGMQPRRTFGLKNSLQATTPAAQKPLAKSASRGGGDINIHPGIAGGGLAFAIAIGAVLMLGGQPAPPPGGPQIVEVTATGAQPAPAAAPATPAQPPAAGGKFGAATQGLATAR